MKKLKSLAALFYAAVVLLTFPVPGQAGWTSMDSGTTQYLAGVWGSSGSDVFAVGQSGTILHYDGTSWSSMDSGTSDILYGVWGSSGSDVFAVGYYGEIPHYDGTSWSSMDPGTSIYFDDVWGSSGSDVFAVGAVGGGDGGTIRHYDGTSWSSMDPGISYALYGVWGSSGSDVFAVGDSGTILRYDGTSWSSMDSGATQCLYGVWGSSGSDVFAVGDGGTILHYDGTSWSSMDSGTSSHLSGVWGSSGSDVFAVGYDGTIQHYDGTSWSSMDSGTSSRLYGVWGSSGSDVFAVGYDGTILHYDGIPPASSPTVTTAAISGVTSSSATCGGNVTSDGNADITARGVCWNTSGTPTTAHSKTSDGTGTGIFTSTLTGLASGTTYYVRAYATNSEGTAYGEEVTFVTNSVPVVTTASIGDVTSATAICGGNVTSDGNADITARGVCWNTSGTPTTAGSKTSDGTGAGIFTSTLTGLASGTTYYVRAYATNSEGTAYGDEVTFATVTNSVPVVTTEAISDITSSSATCGGNVTSDGNADITARGVCWNTSGTPTTADSKTSDGTGTGIFTSTLTELASGTTYYVRAYATNSEGTAYGDEVTFVTSSVPVVTTAAISDITSSSATCGGNVTSDGNADISARGVCWNTSGTPTTDDSSTSDGTGTGIFTSTLTGLDRDTTYYVRAYATNSEGTAYGEEVTFVTSSLPVVTTEAISDITSGTAICGGNVTSDGNADITARGVCWNTSGTPTTDDNKTSDGTGAGIFTSTLTGLDRDTTYYVRAYATNSEGTAYGEEVTFATNSLPVVATTAISDLTSSSAISGGNVTSDGNSEITARGVCWNTSGTPTTDDSRTSDGTGTGIFTSTLTELAPGATYYVRAYATNSEGTAYGDEVTFAINGVPAVTGQKALSVPERTPLTVTPDDLTVTDADNTYPDEFTLTLYDGDNYTRSGATVTPVNGFVGEMTVPLTVNDGTEDSDVFQLKITVTGSDNAAPVITGQTGALSVARGTGLAITLDTLVVTDPDSDWPDDFTLTVSDGTGYTHSANTVIPLSGVTGVLTVPVTVNDGIADSDPYNLSVTVTGETANAPEITGQSSLSLVRDTELTLTLDDLTVTPGSADAEDVMLILGEGENYTLRGNTVVPDPGFSGTLTIPVTVSDGTGSTVSFVTITVESERTDAKTLTGTVKTDDGTGMSGLIVTAVNADIGETRSGVTGAGGAFSVAVSCGTWKVEVTQADDADWAAPEAETVSFANDNGTDTEDLDIILETRIARLTGKVLPPEGDTGLGEGVTMNVFCSDTQFSRDFHPDADGAFSFPVPAGTYEVTVLPDPLEYPKYGRAEVSLTRAEGDTDLGDVRLAARSAVLSGTVRDDGGQGIPGIPVNVWRTRGESFSVTTGTDGGYEISLVPGTWTAKPSPAEDANLIFTGSPAEAVLTAGDTAAADFVLDHASHVIFGRVRDTAGKVLSDVDAWAYARHEDSPAPVARARVAKGEFTLNVPAGTFRTGIDLAPGSGYAFAQENQSSLAKSSLASRPSPLAAYEQVTSTDGRGRSSDDIMITLEPDNAYIKGVLRDEGGALLTGVRGQVLAVPEGNRSSVRKAEIRDGEFEISVSQGAWTLNCRPDTDRYAHAAPARVVAEKGRAVTADITLTALDGVISGQVRDDGGNPAADILVWVRVPREGRGDAGRMFEAQVLTDSDGGFEVFVPGGTGKRGWGVSASVGTALRRCETEEDSYEPPFVLTGESLLLLEDAEVPGEVVSVLGGLSDLTYESEYEFTFALREALDSYYFYQQYKSQIMEHAAAGATEGMIVACLRESAAQAALPANRPGWGRKPARQDGMSLDLRRADIFLAGTVLDEDGSPAPGVYVSAYSGDGQKTHGRTDGNGDYRLYVARADETGSNDWTLTAVSESPDGKYCRGRVLCDASGTDEIVAAEDIVLKSEGELPDVLTGEFRREDGWTGTLSDGTRIQIPANAVPTEEEFVRIIAEARAEETSESGGNHIITYSHSVTLYEKESGREILGGLDREVLITFGYDTDVLQEQGIWTRNIRPGYLSGASGTWRPSENFTSDGTGDSVTLGTGHLSVWSLTATRTGDGSEPGDMDNDGELSLADAIAALKVCVESPSSVSPGADVSGDGKIGLAEVIYILIHVAGN
ncbi:hypothetical protein [Desulfonema magnum]|uniref:Fibronectin domain-containing protein n=1 Tax=Desulfonema magnum TaxID=45655 RepID=A0A975BGB0_9BACT|nr:hypothetical protein [Desulfonema magnum]QTA84768.1 fibronectin domain-containing protein [Desulfonema magnum]